MFNGLERSQFLMICHTGHWDGLERSKILLYRQWSWKGSICTKIHYFSQMVLKEVNVYCYTVCCLWVWLSYPSCIVMLYLCTCGLHASTVWGGFKHLMPMQGCSPCRFWPSSNALERSPFSWIYFQWLICFWILTWTICHTQWSWKEVGGVLLGSMVISPLLHSMEVSPLSMEISLWSWGSLVL